MSDASDRHRRAGILRLEAERQLDSGGTAEALELLAEARRLHPLSRDVLETLARAHYEAGDTDSAATQCELALGLDPGRHSCWRKLGLIREKQGRLAEAATAYRTCLECGGEPATVHTNLGRVHYGLGDPEAAAGHYLAALDAAPDRPEAHNGLAISRLALAPDEPAWREHEWRLRTPHYLTAHDDAVTGAPRWTGGRVEGTLLILGEQGLGDNLFFSRWLSDITGLADSIRLEVAPPLVRLFDASFPQITVDSRPGPEAPAAWISLGSLPLVTGIHSRPLDGPSLRVDPELVEEWKGRVDPDSVGFVWRGTTFSVADDLLSETLGRNPRIRAVSLQYGGAPPTGLAHPGTITDLADSAALTLACRRVITIDSAQAHLSGSLMQPFDLVQRGTLVDWRWHPERGRYWYPTVRPHRGSDWTGILDRALAAG